MGALVDHQPGSGDADELDDPETPDGHASEAAPPDAEQPDDAGTAGEQAGGELAAEVAQAHVEQDGPAPSPAQLRVDFGAHFEANYQRLVAQLYAITLDPREAHTVVQDAYSRAWRSWAAVSRSADPTAWVRRVAVRSTIRSWRRALARIGIGRPRPAGDGADPRTGALLSALGRLPAAERRCVVLSHMAGADLGEIAAVEQVTRGTVQARLARARQVVAEGMADVLSEVLGSAYEERPDEAQDGDDSARAPGEYDSDLYDAVYDNKGDFR